MLPFKCLLSEAVALIFARLISDAEGSAWFIREQAEPAGLPDMTGFRAKTQSGISFGCVCFISATAGNQRQAASIGIITPFTTLC